jgi:DNA-binding GntR family transcriptional regulator
MPTKGSLVESIYEAIKLEVTSGDLRPGHRVDISDLCARYHVSKSPIRNILNRLVGEGLLEAHAHDGFFRPWLTEQSLRDLYQWSQDILLLALDKAECLVEDSLVAAKYDDTTEDLTHRTERFFTGLAERGGNAEYVAAISDINTRLRSVRRRKPATLFDTDTELRGLDTAWNRDDRSSLKAQIELYHQRRLAAIAQIVAAAYR